MKYNTPDLNDCDKEPIHIIGHIQSYGYLLILNKNEFVVEQTSENIEKLLGVPMKEVLGNPVDYFFPFSFLDHFNQYINDSRNDDHYSLSFELGKKDYILTTHSIDDRLVLEIEPDNPADRKTSYHKYADLVDNLSYDIDKPGSLKEIFDLILERMHPILGFDRMMVYHFDEDDHGEVWAERSADGVNKYMGLKFPNTDIPKQARELYLKNTTRGISNVNDAPVPISPVTRKSDKKPADLTYSYLRSVSPIHIEYLKNMEVTSSFSISLIIRNRLWGMILCHHESGPLKLNIHQRRSASFIGNILSQKISSLIEENRLDGLRNRLRGMRGIIGNFITSENLHSSVEKNKEALISNFEASSYALFYDGKISKSSNSLPEDWIIDVKAKIAANNKNVFTSHNLCKSLPDIEYNNTLPAGVLAIRLSKELNEFLLIFRNEQFHTVDWAGKPEKPSDKKLSPRSSFDKWTEEVKGQSARWKQDEVLFAEELRMQLIENIISVANRNTKSDAFEFRKRLEERNRELEAKNRELYEELERLRRMESEHGITKEVLSAKNDLHTLKNVRKQG